MTTETADPGEAEETLPEWVTALGIVDKDSAIELAKSAHEKITAATMSAISVTDQLTVSHLVLMGMTTRAQCLAMATSDALASENPYSTFTLLRSYFENAATLVYVIDKPGQLGQLWGDGDGHGIKIGRIVNHSRTRFKQGKHIYDQLSKYAHPHSISIVSAMQIVEGGRFNWSTGPRFKSPEELLLAAAWLLELTDATAGLIAEFSRRFFRPSPNSLGKASLQD
ncbi:hypothetical protein [Nocardia noduli]|uniref:hypothetical protein n=1 Tax=Nocardia noduli TaxID=2815722 RepID=UPI001C2327A3|nr:hypothetical protein [Nocardia noduli]